MSQDKLILGEKMIGTLIKNSFFRQMPEEYEKKESTHILFWCLMAGFMGLIFVRNIIGYSFNIAILLIYACVMAFFADHNEMMALAASFVPFSAAFQYRYAILAIIVLYIIKYNNQMRRLNLNVYAPLLFLMAWELIHGAVYDFSLVSYLQGFSELMLLTFVISLPNKKFDYAFISRVLVITTIFSCFIILLKLLNEVGYDFKAVFLDGTYRLGPSAFDGATAKGRSYVFNYNANDLGFICNLSISALLLRMRMKKVSALDIAFIVILCFFGALTLSRTFVLCLAIIFLLYSLSGKGNVIKKIRNIILAGVIVVIGLIVFASIIPYVFDNILNRFNTDDITGGRSYLLEWYNDYLFESPVNILFGTGLQDSLARVNMLSERTIETVPHNCIQELLVVWGVLGLAVFVIMMLVMVNVAGKANPKMKFVNFIPFILTFVKAQAGQLITAERSLLVLTFLYIALCTDFTNKEESDLEEVKF